MAHGDFAPFESKMRESGLPAVAIRTFRHYYEQLLEGSLGTLSNREIEPVSEVPVLAGLDRYRDPGQQALARCVVIKLNGGLGTSMGMTRAKSLLPLKDDLTFLDIIARQILDLRDRHACQIPLVLMNSFRTREDSLALLSRYPDLAKGTPLDFLQHKVPRILAEDFTPAEWPERPEYEWCPPGHGDLYTALETSGMLDQLLEGGFRYAFVSNGDNLGATLEPAILGWMAAEGLPFVLEVCGRTEADEKGGHIARLGDGRITLREIAQCPENELDSFQDVHRFRHFNTNNLWVDLEVLKQQLDAREGILGLPMIRNEKPVDPQDASSPKVLQLETAMGAAISVFDGGQALEVPRDRFAPVKTTNDLLVVWSDAYQLTGDFRLVPAAGRHPGDLVVDLDPVHYRRVDQLKERFPGGAPSLVGCSRLSVRGDVRFGRDVVCEGRVEIAATGEGPLEVPDGQTLSG